FPDPAIPADPLTCADVRDPRATSAAGAAWTPLTWTLPIDRLAELPPPTCAVPTERSAVFPDPAIPADPLTCADVRDPRATSAAGAAWTPLTWTLPIDRLAELPPPTCAVPTERSAVFPDPAIPADPLTCADVRDPRATSAAGAAWTPLTWTLPIDRLAELPPPTCAVPTERSAVFPDPAIPADPLTCADVRDPRATSAAGAAWTPLTWTLPIDRLAELPPPACAVPTERSAVFPDPAIPADPLTWADVRDPRATSAAGAAWTPLTWTLPIDRLAELPPPACAVPTERSALFPAPPVTPAAPTSADRRDPPATSTAG